MTTLATEVPKASLAFPTQHPSRSVRAAVVGLGRAGIEHAAVLSTVPECTLVAVCDPDRSARRNLRGLGYAAPGFDGVEALLAKTHPEAVVICAPMTQRASATRRALEAGAAVLVDGPIAPTLAEARALVDLAAAKPLPLASAHPLAFEPVFQQVQRVLDAKVLGEVRQVRSSMYLSRVFSTAQKARLAPAESGGGVLTQAASNLLFLLVQLLGVPASVRATSSELYGRFEDELHAMMTMPGGVEVGFDCSWSVPGYPRSATVLEIEAEYGKLLASEDALEIELDEPRALMPRGHTRIGHEALPQTARFELGGEALYLQDSAFLAWATGGPAPPNRADRAIDMLRVMLAIYDSIRDGGKSVAMAA
jgi:predicted dehydrogenase